MGQHRNRRAESHVNVASKQGGHSFAGAFEGHVQHVNAGLRFESFARQVWRTANAGGHERELPWCSLGSRNQVCH